MASGQPESSEVERRMLAADGEPLLARTRTGLVRDLAGRLDHLMVLLDDVVEG